MAGGGWPTGGWRAWRSWRRSRWTGRRCWWACRWCWRPTGGLGGPGGGVGGPAGGVGGPAGGVGGVSGDSGASLTEAELGACASNGSSVLEGCESGASRTGLALRIGASLASLLEVNPVDKVSKSDLIRVSPPSEFSAE